MNEITTFSANVPIAFGFKSDKLNAASAIIATEIAKMNNLAAGVKDANEAFNRAVAPVLAEVMEDKLYKADGFSSVADYAEQTFGLKRSFAYMLARVGKRVKTLPALSEFTTSNAAELVNADGEAVTEAVESGELSSESTQQQLREFALAHPIKAPKAKLVPTFDFFFCDGSVAYENMTIDAFEDKYRNGECVFFKAPKSVIENTYVFIEKDGRAATIRYKLHEAKQSKSNFLDDLKAMLAKATPEQLDALKATFTERGKEA